MTEGGAVEAADLIDTAVGNHAETHTYHERLREAHHYTAVCSCGWESEEEANNVRPRRQWDAHFERTKLQAIAQAAQEEAEAKVARLREALKVSTYAYHKEAHSDHPDWMTCPFSACQKATAALSDGSSMSSDEIGT